MPNWVKNRITVIKGDYDLSSINTFNTVMPMPTALKDIEHNGIATDVEQMLGVVKTYFSDRPTFPELEAKYIERKDKDAFRQLMSNQIMYGATTFYQWSVINWGTKWDMCEVVCDSNVLQFDTAWSAPVPWTEALSKTLPEGVILEVEYADEDAGRNAGTIKLSNTECIGNHFDNNSDEAWQMAVKLHELDDLYKKINGRWVCTED